MKIKPIGGLGPDIISGMAEVPPGVIHLRDFPAEYPHQKDLGNRRRRMLSPYRYTFGHGGVQWRITVPIDFEHDGASVPGITWSFYRPHSLDASAVLHDWLYRHQGRIPVASQERRIGDDWILTTKTWTRKEADQVFRLCLKMDPNGPNALKRWMAYSAVRAGGRGPWRR